MAPGADGQPFVIHGGDGDEVGLRPGCGAHAPVGPSAIENELLLPPESGQIGSDGKDHRKIPAQHGFHAFPHGVCAEAPGGAIGDTAPPELPVEAQRHTRAGHTHMGQGAQESAAQVHACPVEFRQRDGIKADDPLEQAVTQAVEACKIGQQIGAGDQAAAGITDVLPGQKILAAAVQMAAVGGADLRQGMIKHRQLQVITHRITSVGRSWVRQRINMAATWARLAPARGERVETLPLPTPLTMPRPTAQAMASRA